MKHLAAWWYYTHSKYSYKNILKQNNRHLLKEKTKQIIANILAKNPNLVQLIFDNSVWSKIQQVLVPQCIMPHIIF